jgi:hypothetical protein
MAKRVGHADLSDDRSADVMSNIDGSGNLGCRRDREVK